jgi:hypothetical protein
VERSVESVGLAQDKDRVVATGTAFPGDADLHAYVLADVAIEGGLADGEG